MCGIAGIVDFKNSLLGNRKIKKMVCSLNHRGPDQAGIYSFRGRTATASLGSARLSIIDIEDGAQPICNEDSRYWITFNGEIYNHPELREQLMESGHNLKTRTDTEVIVHLYEEFGEDCVQLLNGQFAFAIWDEQREELFMARDRLGVRPLYYYQDSSLTFYFSSEIKAIMATGDVSLRISPHAMRQILTLWNPISPSTIFESIKSLPPGNSLRVTRSGQIITRQYWFPDFGNIDNSVRESQTEAATKLRALLTDATRIRLRADVPVGVYLSGGLDSSSIAALTSQLSSSTIETFSISFTDSNFDEASHQQLMAQYLHTNHHTLTCTYKQIGEAFRDAIWHIETPILRTAPIPLFMLSSLVKSQNIKVVLTGEGADEVFAGYDIFKEALVRRFWSRNPDSVFRPALLQKLYADVNTLTHDQIPLLKLAFGPGLMDTNNPFYSHNIRWRSGAKLMLYLSREYRKGSWESITEAIELPKNFEKWHPLMQAQFLEMKTFLSEYLLNSQGDRPSMAHSVEGRYPFLDHRIVEFANSLPPSYKLLGLREKHILKQAMKNIVPNEILARVKKPFRAPIHQCFFKDGEPVDWVKDFLSNRAILESGIFEANAVQRLLQKVANSETIGEVDSMALVGILSTQLIHNKFVSHFSPSDIDPTIQFLEILRDSPYRNEPLRSQ